MKVTVSAPGKVNLMGEHAIVYGRPSVLAAVDFRLSATVSDHSEGIHIEAPEDAGYIQQAVFNTASHFGIGKLPGMRITIQSGIPIGYHLGSSAAVAVAVCGAVSYFVKRIFNPELINRIAYDTEKAKHGNPSGGDNTASCFGGFIWYRKELEFLRTLWQLPIKITPELSHFYLVDTGRPEETTGEMVAYVSERRMQSPEAYERIFAENEIQVKRVTMALKQNDSEELSDAIRTGSRTLSEMGVVSEYAGSMIAAVEKSGGAAKILGGGGRKHGAGYLLAYHEDKTALIRAVGDTHKIREVTLGCEGARLEGYE
jgi:mevalonate kinase